MHPFFLQNIPKKKTKISKIGAFSGRKVFTEKAKKYSFLFKKTEKK